MNYYITHYSVKNLWGHKSYPIKLNRDVNVLIGPNASGKTTLINLLYDTLTGNISRLFRTEFSELSINLKSFEGDAKETITAIQRSEEFEIIIGKSNFMIPSGLIRNFPEDRLYGEMNLEVRRRRYRVNFQEIQEKLRGFVPAVWLPVSRRLPITEEEEDLRRSIHRKPLESVDECLSGLIEKLKSYRLSLNTDLAELRKEFQKHALENILFDKKHDRWAGRTSSPVAPSENDKQQLLKAFRDVGLVDARMEPRIDEHFDAARDAIAKLKAGKDALDIDTVLIVPLIARTSAMVVFAQELETKRGELFEPLKRYVEIVNSFLNDKNISVSDRGDLIIIPNRDRQDPIEWRHLSSGEKQILILLTQALLTAKSPLVYVADEPELSLHVTWQEMLLGSLTKLAGQCQFIVATHSPDIAAGFGDKIIDLARL